MHSKIKDYGLATMSYDEIELLATSLIELPERRLLPTWAYIQSMKYNAMLQDGDYSQPEIIFNAVELPLIKRIYPSEAVNAKVKSHLKKRLKQARGYSKGKFEQYREMRRYGMSIEDSRKKLAPMHPDMLIRKMIAMWSMPIRYQYELSSKDADMFWQMGIDKFIETFPDRFYVRIINNIYNNEYNY